MANDISSKVVLGIDVNEFRRGVTQVDSSLKRLSAQFNNLGGVIGATFITSKLSEFGREALHLGVQMEGVRAAFSKLNNEADLDKLRGAVKGTISDLNLMKEANKAASVNIGMETLSTTMQYLQKYSRATGDSMEKLMGDATQELIRQTGLRLDQLGIDLLTVRDRMKVTGDYTEAVLSVMRDNMKRLGDETLTTADKIDQQKARIENLEAAIGEKMLPAYAWFLDTVATIMEKIGALTDKVGSGMSQILDAAAKIPVLLLGGADITTGTSGNGSGEMAFLARQQMVGMAPPELQFVKAEAEKAAESLETLKEKLQALRNAFERAPIGSTQFFELRTEIAQAEQKIKDLTAGVVPNTDAINLQAKGVKSLTLDYGQHGQVLRQISPVYNDLAVRTKKIIEAYKEWDKEMALLNYVAQEFGMIMTTSFSAALNSGEDFFDTLKQGITNYIKQIIAATAATLALAAAISIIFPKIGFNAAVAGIGGSLGLPIGLNGNDELIFKIAGFDMTAKNIPRGQKGLNILGIGN